MAKSMSSQELSRLTNKLAVLYTHSHGVGVSVWDVSTNQRLADYHVPEVIRLCCVEFNPIRPQLFVVLGQFQSCRFGCMLCYCHCSTVKHDFEKASEMFFFSCLEMVIKHYWLV